jgi:transposase
MRFVPIKTEAQLDPQALHRVRERWVMRRTAVVNQICSLLLERGLTLPKGRSHLDEQLPGMLEDAELNLSDSFRVLLAQLKLELQQLAARIEEMDRVIQKTAREHEACQRLTEIPGVGPATATALVAAVGNGSAFKKGEICRPGWGSFRESTPPAVNRSYWAPANGAINTYEDSSFRAHAAYCNSE